MAVPVVEAGNACRRQHEASKEGGEEGKQRRPLRRGCGGLAEFTLRCGMDEEIQTRTWEAPETVSHSNARTYVEYPHRESIRSEVADVLVVLRDRESL